MIEKLGYLDKLKKSMGEEMAEMMSEEITKVMNEQRDLEHEYAALITQRSQLKGISNKAKLDETKKEIEVSMRVLNFEVEIQTINQLPGCREISVTTFA